MPPTLRSDADNCAVPKRLHSKPIMLVKPLITDLYRQIVPHRYPDNCAAAVLLKPSFHSLDRSAISYADH